MSEPCLICGEPYPPNGLIVCNECEREQEFKCEHIFTQMDAKLATLDGSICLRCNKLIG